MGFGDRTGHSFDSSKTSGFTLISDLFVSQDSHLVNGLDELKQNETKQTENKPKNSLGPCKLTVRWFKGSFWDKISLGKSGTKPQLPSSSWISFWEHSRNMTDLYFLLFKCYFRERDTPCVRTNSNKIRLLWGFRRSTSLRTMTDFRQSLSASFYISDFQLGKKFSIKTDKGQTE